MTLKTIWNWLKWLSGHYRPFFKDADGKLYAKIGGTVMRLDRKKDLKRRKKRADMREFFKG